MATPLRRSRRAFLRAAGVALSLIGVLACTADRRPNLPRPVQIGREPRATDVPPPTATTRPPPRCGPGGVEVPRWSFERSSTTTYLLSGEVHSTCEEVVDVTLRVRFVDGTDRPVDLRAFAVLRRLEPLETRTFREQATGARNSTRLEVAAEWVRSPPLRRR